MGVSRRSPRVPFSFVFVLLGVPLLLSSHYAGGGAAAAGPCDTIKSTVTQLEKKCSIDRQLCGERPFIKEGECGVAQDTAFKFSSSGCGLCKSRQLDVYAESCDNLKGTSSSFDEYCRTVVCESFCKKENLLLSDCAKHEAVAPYCKYVGPPISSEDCRKVQPIGNVKESYCQETACEYCKKYYPTEGLASCIEMNFKDYCVAEGAPTTDPDVKCESFEGVHPDDTEWCQSMACDWCKTTMAMPLESCFEQYFKEDCKLISSTTEIPGASTTPDKEKCKKYTELVALVPAKFCADKACPWCQTQPTTLEECMASEYANECVEADSKSSCPQIKKAAQRLRATGCDVEPFLCGLQATFSPGDCGRVQQSAVDLYSSGCPICDDLTIATSCDDFHGVYELYDDWCREAQCLDYCVAAGADLDGCMASVADFCRRKE